MYGQQPVLRLHVQWVAPLHAAAGWAALGPVGQNSHLIGSEKRFPLEVESCRRGGATTALVDAFDKVDVDLNLGHEALN